MEQKNQAKSSSSEEDKIVPKTTPLLEASQLSGTEPEPSPIPTETEEPVTTAEPTPSQTPAATPTPTNDLSSYSDMIIKPTPTAEPIPDEIIDTGASEDVNYEVNLRITELYVIQALFFDQINQVIKDTATEFGLLPSEEKTTKNRYTFALKKVSVMAGLESDCDTQVYGIINEIRGILSDAGQSTAMCDEMAEHYETKKADQKAYYIGLLLSDDPDLY